MLLFSIRPLVALRRGLLDDGEGCDADAGEEEDEEAVGAGPIIPPRLAGKTLGTLKPGAPIVKGSKLSALLRESCMKRASSALNRDVDAEAGAIADEEEEDDDEDDEGKRAPSMLWTGTDCGEGGAIAMSKLVFCPLPDFV